METASPREIAGSVFGGKNGLSRIPNKTSVLEHICECGHNGLRMLLEAAIYAQDLDHSLWDFSVEIELLANGGLAHSDLRWLICKGYLEQAGEVECGEPKARRFQASSSLSFNKSSCFILTEAGQLFVRQSLGGIPLRESGNGRLPARRAQHPFEQQQMKPFWDRDRQELRVGNQVVKQFKVPAPNQEIILAAFHEENWPVRIDDPLPPRPELEPKRRLHDTINSLNRHQKSDLLRFLGDGTGQGVRWEFGVRA